jgi:hypothetical protein
MTNSVSIDSPLLRWVTPLELLQADAESETRYVSRWYASTAEVWVCLNQWNQCIQFVKHRLINPDL